MELVIGIIKLILEIMRFVLGVLAAFRFFKGDPNENKTLWFGIAFCVLYSVNF